MNYALPYTIICEGKVVAAFKNVGDRDFCFLLLREEFPDVGWSKGGWE